MSYSEKDRQISQLSSKVREKEAEASRLRADHQTKIAQVRSVVSIESNGRVLSENNTSYRIRVLKCKSRNGKESKLTRWVSNL